MKKKYPDFVLNWLQANNQNNQYEVSFINGGYYLYIRNSGNKPHQYVGALKEDGLHNKKSRMHPAEPPSSRLPSTISPVSSSTEVWEYGFSKAMIHLCPDSWKESVGDHWDDILTEIILRQSPRSFLSPDFSNTRRRHYPGAAQNLLEKKMGIPIQTLYNTMGSVFLICADNKYMLSKLSEEQAQFCKDKDIRLEAN